MTGATAVVPAGVGGVAGLSGTGGFAVDPGNAQTHLAVPTAQAEPGPDPFEAFYRPAPGEPSPHTRTQVMPAIPPQAPPPGADQGQAYQGHGYPAQPHQDPSFHQAPAQPAYDQPIDYQAATDRPYSEPYEGPYADDYADGPAEPRPNRSAMIGIGVAAGAILVIIVSLITLGGGKSTPTPQAANSQPTEVVTPTGPKPTSEPSAAAPTTSTPSTPTIHVPGQLRLGDTGAEVKWLQNRLKQLNFYNGEATGTFDQATAAAVAAFQAHAHTADPTGVVARSTKTALIAAGTRPRISIFNPGDPGSRKKGGSASADDVKRLQRALSVALNQDVKASGEYDMATMGAVMQYQTAVGLGPDGIVGDRVWGALQQGKIAG